MENYDYLFEVEEINSDTKIKGRIEITKAKKQQQLIARLDELQQVMPEVEKDTSLHLISSDNFGSIELLTHLIEKHKPNEIFLTTWSYNEDFVNLCEKYLKNGGKIQFFVDKSIKTRKSHLYAQIVTLAQDYENMTIRIHHMLHSKITLLDCDNMKISIEGSANYSKNQRIENFTITESIELYNFHKNWMLEIIGK